jgi:predicted permease
MYRRLFDRVSVLPGVGSATIARYSPLSGTRSSNNGVVEGYTPSANENVEFEMLHIGPSYAATLGVPVVHGRDVGVQDAAGTAPVGLVNEAFVRKYFPGQNPLGRHFGVNGSPGDANIEIVGVVKDAWFRDWQDDIKPIVFPALLQERSQFALDAEVALRTVGDPAAAAAELRRAIAEVDPNLPVNDPRTLREQVASNFDSERLAARLIGFFGALALLLAAVGLYGVITQGVVQRTAEIGLRMALGAERKSVLWMILRDVLALLAIGLAAGTAAAFAAARLVASQVHGFRSAAPPSFALAVVLLVVVAIVTGWLPARRATRVDPMLALRRE